MAILQHPILVDSFKIKSFLMKPFLMKMLLSFDIFTSSILLENYRKKTD